jgi:hypothetical protein
LPRAPPIWPRPAWPALSRSAAVKECIRTDNKLDQYLATPEARAIITHANRNLAMGTPMVRSAGSGGTGV